MTSIPYLQRKYKISYAEAKKRLEDSGEKASDVYIHDPNLTKNQRYFLRLKQDPVKYQEYLKRCSENQNKYRQKNPDKYKQSIEKYRESSKFKLSNKNKSKKWQEENRGKFLESQKKYRESAKGKAAYGLRSTLRRMREKFGTIDLTPEEKKQIGDFYAACPNGFHVDHIIPISKGGSFTVDNLQYLPASENFRKSNFIILEIESNKKMPCCLAMIDKVKNIYQSRDQVDVEYLKNTLSISNAYAIALIQHIWPDKNNDSHIPYDPTLTKDQRYYRRHKKVKEKKPRVYHFQKYWKEEWDKAIHGSQTHL